MNTQESHDVAMRAEVALDQKLEDLKLEQAEILCPEFVDDTIQHNRGVIINFFNPNTTASVQNIGGVRLVLDDIRKVPAYIYANEQRIKQIAIKMLDKHIRRAVCPVGAGEALTADDYSLTFAVATLSDEARLVWAKKRGEGPLYICSGENMTKPLLWGRLPDGQPDYAHIIHAYIALLAEPVRRTTAVRKIKKDSSPEFQPYSRRNNGPATYKRARSINSSPPYQSRPRDSPYPSAPVVGDRLASVERNLERLIGLQQPSPALPALSAPPMWHHDGGSTGRNLPPA